MSYFDPQDMTVDEQAEYAAIESRVTSPVEDEQAEIAKAISAAKATLNKTRNITLRLSERDLYRLKAKAAEEGMPYQTLASSILHKATTR